MPVSQDFTRKLTKVVNRFVKMESIIKKEIVNLTVKFNVKPVNCILMNALYVVVKLEKEINVHVEKGILKFKKLIV